MFGILEIAAVIGGFALLVWSADKFVLGASGIARSLGIPTLIIGLVVVGFGTSAPEMLVGAVAAWNGNTGIAIGNAIGSNITNFALVLGITALIAPMVVRSTILRREFPVLFFLMGLTAVLFIDGYLSRNDGYILLVSMVGFFAWLTWAGMKTDPSDPMEQEFEQEIPDHMPLGKSIFWLCTGLVLLLVGAKLIVWGAVEIATFYGVSDLVIGLTVIAIGTSLPELAASIVASRKGEHDIAIGNLIGSNMFNLLGVIGIPAVINPASIDPPALYRDYPVMILITVLLFLMLRRKTKGAGQVTRLKGLGLLTIYIAYMMILYLTAIK